jgi:carbamoyl-phosphate synthase large subunit
VGKLSEIQGTALENAVDLVAQNEITFVVNTPHGRGSREDGEEIRKAANTNRVPSVTTVEAALAAVNGLWEQHNSEVEVRSLQEYHGR